MKTRTWLGLAVMAVLFPTACQDDGPVLYLLDTGGKGGTGGSEAAAGGEAMELSCEPAGIDAPCYCPQRSSCHCEDGGAAEPERVCQVDCPEGGCEVSCESHCNLWCETGCTFECPSGASCYIKCAGDCSVVCRDDSDCKISSYTSPSNVDCQGNAQCLCLKGSLCDCQGSGCIKDQ